MLHCSNSRASCMSLPRAAAERATARRQPVNRLARMPPGPTAPPAAPGHGACTRTTAEALCSCLGAHQEQPYRGHEALHEQQLVAAVLLLVQPAAPTRGCTSIFFICIDQRRDAATTEDTPRQTGKDKPTGHKSRSGKASAAQSMPTTSGFARLVATLVCDRSAGAG